MSKAGYKRMILTDENVVDYDGDRILADGADLSRYLKHPVLLAMHDQNKPIGLVRDLRIENGQITGLPEFDETDEEALKWMRKYEQGHVAVSIRLIPKAYSDNPDTMLPGQRNQTITVWELLENSLVTIPSNPNAVIMKKISEPKTDEMSAQTKQVPEADLLKAVAEKDAAEKALKTAKAAENEALQKAVLAEQKITDLEKRLSETEAEKVKTEAERKKERAADLVKNAIDAGRITAQESAGYIALAEMDYDNTKNVLALRPPRETLLNAMKKAAGENSDRIDTLYKERAEWTIHKWTKEDPIVLEKMKTERPELFNELLKTAKK